MIMMVYCQKSLPQNISAGSVYVFYDLTWLYGPIAAGAALVLTITLFKVPLELMIFDDFEIC